MSRRIFAALAVTGGLLITPQVLPASASAGLSSDAGQLLVLAPTEPPEGKAWLEGVLTDQAGHPLDGVNVEAWRVDTVEPEMVASNFTYAGDPDDGRHDHGVFRLEVPIQAEYEVLFSTDRGEEDGDRFRMDTYVAPNGNDTIKVGTRKTRNLGTTEIARVDAQPSTTRAKLAPTKVKVGKAGKITVTVACKNVAPVTGKVTVAIGGKKVARTLTERNQGTVTLTLPALKNPGRYTVEAWFLGTDTVKKSTAKVKLTVTKK